MDQNHPQVNQAAPNNPQSGFSQYVIAEHRIDGDDVDNAGNNIWDKLNHPDSIRLFKLWRDPASYVLKFALSEHRLSTVPPYAAISYVWGKPGSVGIIECQTGQRVLRRNLFALLNILCNWMAAGDINPETYLWVDALCINQDSLQEKAQQVEQIGQTFSKAEGVLVWLGTHQDGAPSCLEPLSRGEPARRDWARLAAHDYWSRTWVIQEFVIAKDLLLFDDHVQIMGDWFVEKVKNEMRRLDGVLDINKSSSIGPITLRREQEQRPDRRTETTFRSLIHLVSTFSKQECTDPRDRIYALQSLSIEFHRLKVDYTISMACLFWRILRSDINGRTMDRYLQSLDLLRLKPCHLLPPNEQLIGIRHQQHHYTYGQCLSDEEWTSNCRTDTEDLNDIQRIRAAEYISLEIRTRSKSSRHKEFLFAEAEQDSSTSNTIQFPKTFFVSTVRNMWRYEILGGTVRCDELLKQDTLLAIHERRRLIPTQSLITGRQGLVYSEGSTSSLVLEYGQTDSSGWTSARIVALAIYHPNLSLLKLSINEPLLPHKLLFSTLRLRKMQSADGNIEAHMHMSDFATWLILDEILQKPGRYCCSLLNRNLGGSSDTTHNTWNISRAP